MNIEQALSHAKFFIFQDQKELAREKLVAILREDSINAEAWILSAQVSDKLEQVLYCLHRASMINPKALETHPNAPQIRALIDRLEQTLPTVASPLPSESISKAEMQAMPDKPLEPEINGLPELIPEFEFKGISTNSEPHEKESNVLKEQRISMDEKEDFPVISTSYSELSHPASSVADQNEKPSTPVLRRKKRWPWVVGLIMLALLVAVAIFAVRLATDLLPQLLQYSQ